MLPLFFAVGCVAIITLAVAWLLFFRPIKKYWRKRYDNPFSFNNMTCGEDETATSLETQDAVLSKTLQYAELPYDNWDTVVIGSGISGLVTAGILARAGQQVLLLEQHDRAGGCCNQFYSGGVPFATGIYYIGRSSKVESLLYQLTDGRLQGRSLPTSDGVVYRDADGKIRHEQILTFANGFCDTLQRDFPENAAEIAQFVSLLQMGNKKLSDHRKWLIRLKFSPLWLAKIIISFINVGWLTDIKKTRSIKLPDVLYALTNNNYLRTVMAYAIGLCDGNCSGIVWSTYSAVVCAYLNKRGSYLPIGGTSALVYNLITAIGKRKGMVRMGAKVRQITLNVSGRVNGVEVFLGECGDSFPIKAHNVVSTAGIPATVDLLPANTSTRYRKYRKWTAEFIRGHLVHAVVTVVMRGSHADFELPQEGIFWFCVPDLDHLEKWLSKNISEVHAELSKDEPRDQCIAFSFPSANPEFQQLYPDKIACQVLFPTSADWFECSGYSNLETLLGTAAWRQVKASWPQLNDEMVEHLETYLPKQFEGILGRTGGLGYGLNMSSACFTHLTQFAELRPQTDIPGLYLAGQDVLGTGLNACSMSGLACASLILRRNVLDDLKYADKERMQQLEKHFLTPNTDRISHIYYSK